MTIRVSHISSHGIWLLANGKEQFLPFAHFPHFKDHTVAAILNVQQPSLGHYYWPELDIDLSDAIIEHPERFPLIARPSSPAEHDS
jgi:hypothetical protein